MQRKGFDDGETWVSITDLMTVLMVMFLLIAIVYMIKREQVDPLREHRIKEYNLYNALMSEFQEEVEAEVLSVDSSLVLRFMDDKVPMFPQGSWKMEQGFQHLLDTLLPDFLALVTRDTILPFIAEVRLEGHTNSDGDETYELDHWGDYPDHMFTSPKEKKEYLSFDYNLWLSQARARAVLRFIRAHPAYRKYPLEIRKELDFRLTAEGLSFSRRLDIDAEPAHLSGKSENKAKSRRVEFRVVTSRPDQLDKSLEQNQGSP